MRPLCLLIIVAIFGGIIILAAAIVLTSPVLTSTALKPAPASGVQYGLDVSLPGPRYHTGIDFETLQSDDHLVVIPLKSARQQVTNYSCGAVAAMTVMSYYGMPVNNTDAGEYRIAHEMYSKVTEKTGINPEQVTQWFILEGMNATWGTGGSSAMLRGNLQNGIPTMVEWMDWGGHWVVVVGYDTRGTEIIWDDVIIFADSVDCHDDRVDGITYFNYGRFDAMWFDAHYFPEGMRDRVYVVAVPGNTPLPR
jgi:hypothetical protein